MIPHFHVIEAQSHHCGAIARRLRFEHQAAILTLGIKAHYELRARFDTSSFRRAWLADGRLIGVGGVTGSMLDTSGLVWLALAEEALRYPLAIVREARRQLDEIMLTKRMLYTMILDGDPTSRRFALFMGFHTDESTAALSRAGRRNLLRFLGDEPPSRLPVGRGSAIVVQYEGRL